MATRAEDRSLSELLSDVTGEIATLFRKEVELARAETSEQVSRAAKAGAMLGAAAVVGLLTLILLAFAAAWGLSEVVPEGVAFLIVGLVFGLVAAVLASAGKKKIASVNPMPERTVQTVKADVQVAKDSFSRGVK
ncbi:MAG TPA: phage holin family protein [Acidimicrobiales bacterium]|nr:phage holin family protein [Acidimicrobiales bacterium]